MFCRINFIRSVSLTTCHAFILCLYFCVSTCFAFGLFSWITLAIVGLCMTSVWFFGFTLIWITFDTPVCRILTLACSLTEFMLLCLDTSAFQ